MVVTTTATPWLCDPNSCIWHSTAALTTAGVLQLLSLCPSPSYFTVLWGVLHFPSLLALHLHCLATNEVLPGWLFARNLLMMQGFFPQACFQIVCGLLTRLWILPKPYRKATRFGESEILVCHIQPAAIFWKARLGMSHQKQEQDDGKGQMTAAECRVPCMPSCPQQQLHLCWTAAVPYLLANLLVSCLALATSWQFPVDFAAMGQWGCWDCCC